MKNNVIENRYDLGFFPTPLQPLHRLSEVYSGYSIYIKRDDNTGLATGGNKTRKLEYLIRLALNESCDTVITAGAQQSNHCRQTAAACAVAGLDCHLLLGGKKPARYDGNLLLSSLLGANIHFTGAHRKGEDIQVIKMKLQDKGKKCFVIPYGGSNFTGALGYVHAVEELQKQLAEQDLKIDYVFFPSSSGGMQAGLTLGAELYQLDTTLMPVNIDKDETHGLSLEEVVFGIVREGAGIFEIEREFHLSDISVIRDYDKAGYGVVTDHERFAINLLARTEGILLDPVYTGRACYGMLDYLKKRKIEPGSNVLFWHTGGLPSIFNYSTDLYR